MESAVMRAEEPMQTPQETPHFGHSIEQFLDTFAATENWKEDPVRFLGQMPSIDSIILEMARTPESERAVIREKLKAFQEEVGAYVKEMKASLEKQEAVSEELDNHHSALSMLKQSRR